MDNKPRDICPEARAFYTACRARPGMFISNIMCGADLGALEHFLNGWGYACSEFDEEGRFCGNRADAPVLLPEGFDDYVAAHYGERLSLRAIGYVQYFEHGGDNAIEKFFSLLSEYLVSLGYEPIPVPKKVHGIPDKEGICRISQPELEQLSLSYMKTFNAPPWNDSWTEDTAFERMRTLLWGSGRFGYAVWEKGSILGAVICEREQYYDGEVCRIIELWTDPAHRGKGYGRALIEQVKKRSSGGIYLMTKRTPETVGFYEKCGFSVDGSMCVMQK